MEMTKRSVSIKLNMLIRHIMLYLTFTRCCLAILKGNNYFVILLKTISLHQQPDIIGTRDKSAKPYNNTYD